MSRDKESSTPTVSVRRWPLLEDDYNVALEGDITGKMRCFRSLFEAKRYSEHAGASEMRVSCHTTCQTITSLNRLGAS